ncbi:MAG: hypothetical protein HYT03_01490 [Candidatus Harrisonbacteria bacterium]|nr:hypothetical protein [Candidatus Harrisonbacteria bacterium]
MSGFLFWTGIYFGIGLLLILLCFCFFQLTTIVVSSDAVRFADPHLASQAKKHLEGQEKQFNVFILLVVLITWPLLILHVLISLACSK